MDGLDTSGYTDNGAGQGQAPGGADPQFSAPEGGAQTDPGAGGEAPPVDQQQQTEENLVEQYLKDFRDEQGNFNLDEIAKAFSTREQQRQAIVKQLEDRNKRIEDAAARNAADPRVQQQKQAQQQGQQGQQQGQGQRFPTVEEVLTLPEDWDGYLSQSDLTRLSQVQALIARDAVDKAFSAMEQRLQGQEQQRIAQEEAKYTKRAEVAFGNRYDYLSGTEYPDLAGPEMGDKIANLIIGSKAFQDAKAMRRPLTKEQVDNMILSARQQLTGRAPNTGMNLGRSQDAQRQAAQATLRDTRYPVSGQGAPPIETGADPYDTIDGWLSD